MVYQQYFISNGDTGLVVRNGVNNNFSFLFENQPYQNENVNASFSVAFPANTYLPSIAVTNVSGFPTVAIGTTAGGTDILEMTTINQFTLITFQSYFLNSVTIYFTWFNSATGNVRIDKNVNYF
jgi:hypothetical protein